LTKFEELSEAIAKKNKNSKNGNDEDDDDLDLEVAGAESTKAPLIAHADEDQDGSIIDELCKPRHKANDGYRAQKWDQDY